MTLGRCLLPSHVGCIYVDPPCPMLAMSIQVPDWVQMEFARMSPETWRAESGDFVPMPSFLM